MSYGTSRLKYKQSIDKTEIVAKEDDLKYFEFLENKRIIFVGPSPCIKEKGFGDFIDSFDVVIRTGGSPIVNTKNRHCDYGSQTDVWYIHSGFYKYHSQEKIKNICRDLKTRFICLRGASFQEKESYKTCTLNARKIDAKVSGTRKPTIGAIIINEILSMGFNMTVIGVDFFLNGLENSHIDGYLTPSMETQHSDIKKSSKEHLKTMGHDYHNEHVLFDKWNKEGRLFMDVKTREYLDLSLVKNMNCV